RRGWQACPHGRESLPAGWIGFELGRAPEGLIRKPVRVANDVALQGPGRRPRPELRARDHAGTGPQRPVHRRASAAVLAERYEGAAAHAYDALLNDLALRARVSPCRHDVTVTPSRAP